MATHSILDSDQMVSIYHGAKGKEAYSIRFWNPRLNQDFCLPIWLVAPEQPTSSRPGILDRVDTTVERWWPEQRQFRHFMIHEAKREGSSVVHLHEQTVRYAKTIVGENFLGELFVLTTIGTTFRTWVFKARSEALHPLFGAPGDDRKEYIDASHPYASAYYSAFLDKVRSITLPTVPPLPSQPIPPATGDSDESMVDDGDIPQYPEPELHMCESVKLEYTKNRTKFKFTREEGQIEGIMPVSHWTWSMNLKRWWTYSTTLEMYLCGKAEW